MQEFAARQGNYKIVDDNVGSDGNNVIEVHEPDQESGGEVFMCIHRVCVFVLYVCLYVYVCVCTCVYLCTCMY